MVQSESDKKFKTVGNVINAGEGKKVYRSCELTIQFALIMALKDIKFDLQHVKRIMATLSFSLADATL